MIYPRSHDGKPEAAIRSRLIDNGNGLGVHVLESGFESGNRPCVLLLHGFPEIAYSWRKLLPLLAAAGFHVVAPDQRGYGRTTGWDDRYDGDLASFHLLNLVKDTLGLVRALRLSSVASVIGHDFGSPVAAWCALLHPHVFRSAALLSAPFGGPPGPASGTRSMSALAESLAALQPPRKHYQWYFSTSAADADMRELPAGNRSLSARLFSRQKCRLEGEHTAFRSHLGPPPNSPKCPSTTSWISVRTCRDGRRAAPSDVEPHAALGYGR